MTHEEIRAAIGANPSLLVLDGSGRPDTTATAVALSAGRTRLGTVSVGVFAIWAAETGMRAVIEDHATNAASPMRSVALALRDVLTGNIGGIRLDLPANIDTLAAWVSAGLLSAQHRDALLALATTPDPVPEFEVRCAIYADDGTLRV